MPISRLLPAVVAVAVFSLSQYANAQTPLPQFYDANFQACLTEQVARNGWTSAEQVTVLSCPNRGIEMLGGVQQLMNLAELDLSNNVVRGTWDLNGLNQLGKLNLAGNSSIALDDLRFTIQKLPALRSLNLNGIKIGSINNLGGLLSQINWQPLPLVELDLGNTGLQDERGGKSLDFLHNFTTLKKLNVADNGIQNPNGIAAASELEELDLSNNQVPYLGVLQQLTKLKRLNLSGNKQLPLQEIAFLISRNPGLTSINLNGIAIGNISNLGPLVDSRTGQPLNLTELDLGNTGLRDTSGEGTLNFLRPFVNLRKLNLANNSVTEAFALDQMQQLEELDLSGNQLVNLGGLLPLHNLTRLNLSGNRSLRFDEINGILLAGNPKLNRIGLNGILIGPNTAWLGNIAANPQQAAGLLELDLGNTFINADALTTLNSFPNLQRLNLAGNGYGMEGFYGALREMRKLQDLDLSGNGFRDAYFIQGMTGLRRLNLSNTLVRASDVRPVIESSPNLRSLSLNGIAIARINELGDLRNRQTGQPLDLLELDLGNTGLQGDWGSYGFQFLQQFPNLQRLNMSGNGIEDVYEYMQMPSLQLLDLSNNKLRVFHPGSYGNLVRLNLSGNAALDARSLNGQFGQMSSLTSLGLNGIAIDDINNLGPLVDRYTGRPLNLTELDLGNTGVADNNGLPNFLQQFPNLRALNLANNGISDIFPLSNMLQLQELDLSGNQVAQLGNLYRLRGLTRLNLSGNRALRMDDVAPILAGNHQLNRLGLNGIRSDQSTEWLRSISQFDDQVNGMLELDLGNTGITADMVSLLSRFVNLQRLSLANNALPVETNWGFMREFGKLLELDLSGNSLVNAYFFGNTANLRRLNLSNTGMRRDDVRALLSQCPNLTSISLNGIAIGNVSNLGDLRNRQTWEFLNLTELDLGNTGLEGSRGKSGFEFLRQFPNLQRLNLAGNGIEQLPEYADLPKLQDLDVSNNRLEFLLAGSQTRLQRLNLSGNTQLRVSEIGMLISRSRELKSLGLNGIAIGAISNLGPLNDTATGQFLPLTEIDLGNTGVLDYDGRKTANFLTPFTNLQRINLAGNGIGEINVLGSFTKLRDLDLSNNALQDVTPLGSLRKLSRLNLSGNVSINSSPLRPLLDQSVNLQSLGLNGIELRDISALGNLQNPQTGRAYDLLELDLGNTRLAANGNTGAAWLAGLSGMQRLNLAGNGLLDMRGIEGLTRLTELDLSNNALLDVSALMPLRNLARLNLSGNSTLPSWQVGNILRQNGGITHLGLNGINLGSLSGMNYFNGSYGPLPLVELDIGNTLMQEIDGLNFLQSFPGITRLNLAGNNLRSFNGARMLPLLADLDVSNNGITVLWDVAIHTLKTLNLAGNNQIPCVDLDQFVSMMNNTVVTRPASCGTLNQPPTASAGADQTLNYVSNITLTGSGVDSDGTISSYAWLQTAGPQVFLTPPDAASTSFAVPELTSPTVFSFQLTVVDDKGASATSTTNVTVKPLVNEPPVASAGANQTAQEGANVVLEGSATDSDGTIASFDWIQTAGPAVVLSTPKAASSGFVAPAVSADTVFTFQLTVQDNKGASASNTTNVLVKPKPNASPVANAGSAQTVAAGGNVTLAGSGTDSDGSIASYNWVQTAGPAVTLSAPKAASTGFVAPAVAVDSILTFQLTVTDDRGATATSSVSITVKAKPNLPPVASAGSAQTVVGGATVTLNGSGTDSDGSIASFAWSQTAGAAVVLSAPMAATTTFVAPLVSVKTVFTFKMTVVDNRGGSAVSSVNITVNPKPNTAPVANAGASQVVVEGNSVTLAGSGTDSDGAIASYKWTQTGGTAATLATPTAASTTFVAPQVNADTVLSFKLTVTDNKGAVATATTSVTVQNTPDLSLTALSSNLSRVARGASITVNNTIKNGSTKATAFETVTGLYLSKVSGTVKTTDQLLGTVLIPAGLVSGTTSSNATKVVIPANLAPGVYYLGAIADSTNTVAESNESNNTRMGTQITVF